MEQLFNSIWKAPAGDIINGINFIAAAYLLASILGILLGIISFLKFSGLGSKKERVLARIAALERDRHFISEFFCGKTAYPIRLKEWQDKYEKAKAELEKLEQKEKLGVK